MGVCVRYGAGGVLLVGVVAWLAVLGVMLLRKRGHQSRLWRLGDGMWSDRVENVWEQGV